MTRFDGGWIFDEIVGKKKELFKILNVALPSADQVFEMQEDARGLEEEMASDDLIALDDLEEL